jgi:hypothetical protein
MRRRLLALGTLLAALALAASGPAVAGGKTEEILKVQSMVGVPSGLTGSAGAIGTINGAGLPWVIGPAKAVLSVDGSFELKFNDLLFDPNDPAVPPQLRGTNNQATMRAGVSCLTTTGDRVAALTAPFPVTTGAGAGDGRVEATLALPSPCIAPVVLITNAGGTGWFAAAGR